MSIAMTRGEGHLGSFGVMTWLRNRDREAKFKTTGAPRFHTISKNNQQRASPIGRLS